MSRDYGNYEDEPWHKGHGRYAHGHDPNDHYQPHAGQRSHYQGKGAQSHFGEGYWQYPRRPIPPSVENKQESLSDYIFGTIARGIAKFRNG